MGEYSRRSNLKRVHLNPNSEEGKLRRMIRTVAGKRN